MDDSTDIRRLYAIGLNQRGFQVQLASNGAEAVERLSRERPDVILLDWLMPLMDGGDVLERLVPGDGTPIPVIVISGQPVPEHLDPRIRIWLAKPVTIDALVGAIEHCTAAGAGLR